jgi:hypothetical protein
MNSNLTYDVKKKDLEKDASLGAFITRELPKKGLVSSGIMNKDVTSKKI